MAATVLDVLKANVVLVGVELLRRDKEFSEFQNAVQTEVAISASGIVIGPQSSNPQPGRQLSLGRDRIVLETSQSRTTINRDYPSKEGLDRLAEVAGQAIKKSDVSNQALRAFGYNIELVYDQDSGQSALRYLRDRLFPSYLFRDVGWQLIGGAGILDFRGDGDSWKAKIEPRLNDPGATRIFLGLNLHKQETNLPNEDDIRASLGKIWEQAQKFAERLDESKP